MHLALGKESQLTDHGLGVVQHTEVASRIKRVLHHGGHKAAHKATQPLLAIDESSGLPRC